ncbi:hypothetical protein F5Y19DRAFT_483733 [Xylariaceae sp. FL1651]|nr:hypothetical protein F5Y19DRAFT_483733 [Xylariaceae sp. FL1651]
MTTAEAPAPGVAAGVVPEAVIGLVEEGVQESLDEVVQPTELDSESSSPPRADSMGTLASNQSPKLNSLRLRKRANDLDHNQKAHAFKDILGHNATATQQKPSNFDLVVRTHNKVEILEENRESQDRSQQSQQAAEAGLVYGPVPPAYTCINCKKPVRQVDNHPEACRYGLAVVKEKVALVVKSSFISMLKELTGASTLSPSGYEVPRRGSSSFRHGVISYLRLENPKRSLDSILFLRVELHVLFMENIVCVAQHAAHDTQAREEVQTQRGTHIVQEHGLPSRVTIQISSTAVPASRLRNPRAFPSPGTPSYQSAIFLRGFLALSPCALRDRRLRRAHILPAMARSAHVKPGIEGTTTWKAGCKSFGIPQQVNASRELESAAQATCGP